MAKAQRRDSGFVGIDAAIFGAKEMPQARKLFSDFGLAKRHDTAARLVFATEIGSEIVVRPSAAKDLPPPISLTSEFREVIWGVGSAKDVARIAAELSRDRDVRQDRDGTIHAIDDSGIHFVRRSRVAPRPGAKTRRSAAAQRAWRTRSDRRAKSDV
ncbi:MAG TPA: hypothetical protein VGL83_06550 [Stellaceae bacterium]